MNDAVLPPDPESGPAPDLALASAYLDGDVDQAARARVESTPALQALVSSLRHVRHSLADIPPPSAEDRDAAVTAALAEFDALQSTPAASSNVVPLAQRARWSRVLTAAAAAIVVGVVGVSVLKAVGGSSSKSTASQSDGSAEGLAPAVVTDVVTGGGTGASADNGATVTQKTIGAITGSADPLPAYDRPEDLRALPSTVEPTADSSGVVAQGGAPPDGQPLVGPLTFPFTCPLSPQQVFISEILWQSTPAAAVRDTVTGVTQAIDPQCKVLVSVPPQP